MTSRNAPGQLAATSLLLLLLFLAAVAASTAAVPQVTQAQGEVSGTDDLSDTDDPDGPTAPQGEVSDADEPNGPTGLQVEVGDLEMALSWTAAEANWCAVTGYAVDLTRIDQEEQTGEQFVTVIRGNTISTSKTFGELAPNTEYRVTVRSYSQRCEAFSDASPLQGNYWTNLEDSADDPVVHTPKTAPGPPTNVEISQHVKGSSRHNHVRVEWDAPAESANSCPVSWYNIQFSPVDGAWESQITYDTGVLFKDAYVAGTRYLANVYAFSWECNQWSAVGNADETLGQKE